jgi:hypothetical protein
MLLIAAGRGLPVNWVTNTVQIIGPEILLNAALAIVVYPALSVLGRAVGRDRMGL